jgi:hypothetical protein
MLPAGAGGSGEGGSAGPIADAAVPTVRRHGVDANFARKEPCLEAPEGMKMGRLDRQGPSSRLVPVSSM